MVGLAETTIEATQHCVECGAGLGPLHNFCGQCGLPTSSAVWDPHAQHAVEDRTTAVYPRRDPGDTVVPGRRRACASDNVLALRPRSACPESWPEPSRRRRLTIPSELHWSGAANIGRGNTVVAPTPVAARLVLLAPGDYPGDGRVLGEHRVPAGAHLDVGRGFGAPWAADAYLDNWHLRLYACADGMRVFDPGSMGGVYRRLTGPAWLRDGDRFRVGNQFLVYEAAEGLGRCASAAPGYQGRVQVFWARTRVGATHRIHAPGAVVGRDACDIAFPQDCHVSAVHCELSCAGDGLRLEDLGSCNGTYLRVQSGDVIPFGSLVAIGQSLCRVEVG